MRAVLHALFPTVGDVVAGAAWAFLIVLYLVVRFREVAALIDEIFDEVFGSGR